MYWVSLSPHKTKLIEDQIDKDSTSHSMIKLMGGSFHLLRHCFGAEILGMFLLLICNSKILVLVLQPFKRLSRLMTNKILNFLLLQPEPTATSENPEPTQKGHAAPQDFCKTKLIKTASHPLKPMAWESLLPSKNKLIRWSPSKIKLIDKLFWSILSTLH